MAKKSAKPPAAAPAEDAPATPKKSAKKATKKPVPPFTERLVLQRWAFEQLGEGFDGLRARLEKAKPSSSGGLSWYAKALQGIVTVDDDGPRRLSDALVADYDTRIQRYTEAINQRRDPKVRWKYFQWLALLVTEMYLDRWFGDASGLCVELNAVVAAHNEEAGDTIPVYGLDDLRRLAFWCATGSGKTLLLHVNLLQYLAACDRAGRQRPNRILVVCPREELARQHLDEFALSSIDADYFEPQSVLRRAAVAQVMEVTRLKEEGKKKTVDVSAFGDDNLVFVDEAHQGLRTDDSVWKEYRDRLSAKGFAFEYSATFGQAVRASKGDETAQEYARCIALDYAYKRFYDDGYGKDYCILNLKDDPTKELRQRYLVGCLLSYYQQLMLYEKADGALAPYGLARPLWVFVGGKVSGGKDDGVDLPEVLEIILALQRVCARRGETVDHLAALLGRKSGILDGERRDVFAGIFPGLEAPAGEWTAAACDALYGDLLRRVFLSDSPGNVHVQLQRSVDHELVLRVGGGRPFGLVYVGKVKDVEKLCGGKEAKEEGVVVDPPAQGEALFPNLNRADSRTHVLIGSRKFTEGWNSWRVSTLGLMNFGRTEGSQVIQLFGRGVRLRGYEGSLRRSRALQKDKLLPKDAPPRLPVLETLGVFGIRADYMQSFEAYLRAEGLAPQRQVVGSLDDDAPAPTAAGTTTVHIPIKVAIPPSPPLYTFLGDDEVERKGRPRVVLDLPGDEAGTRWIEKHPIKLDWYPHVQSERSAGAHYAKEKLKRARVKLEAAQLAWIDVDALVRGLLRLRDERGDDWCTLSVTREGVNRLLAAPDKWYELYLPREFLELRSWRDVERWQAIAAALLGEYCEKFMARWWDGLCEATLRYAPVTPEDGNFTMSPMPDGGRGWTVEVRDDAGDPESKLWRQRYEAVRDAPSKYYDWLFSEEGFVSAGSLPRGNHLYEPLLVLKRDATPWVKVTPVALDHSEGRFVRDLELYWTHRRAPWLGGCELYLLRNQVRRGVRFFEANNFTPDFLVWLTKGDRQCLAVVDPKGIRNLSGIQDPKFALHALIKKREAEVWRHTKEAGVDLGLSRLALESFIVANTRKHDVGWAEHDDGLLSLDDWFKHHVVFQHEDSDHYVERILRVMAKSLTAPEQVPLFEG